MFFKRFLMQRSIRQACALLLAACVPAIAAAFLSHPRWSEEAVGEGEIALTSALAVQPPVLWVDARPSADYAKERIPGALPLNEDEWNEMLPAVLAAWRPGQTVVVYCSSQSCDVSRQVAKRLRDGFNLGPVFSLHGGWEAWKKK
jgi:rhodanese-related sulfurtransferase